MFSRRRMFYSLFISFLMPPPFNIMKHFFSLFFHARTDMDCYNNLQLVFFAPVFRHSKDAHSVTWAINNKIHIPMSNRNYFYENPIKLLKCCLVVINLNLEPPTIKREWTSIMHHCMIKFLWFPRGKFVRDLGTSMLQFARDIGWPK